jgi:hypothetical protein
MLAAGLAIAGVGTGIALAEPGNDNGPGPGGGSQSSKDADLEPSGPVVRIGAREDRGGFEVGPGGVRISDQAGFRGGFDLGPGGPRFMIDERGVRSAFRFGPGGSRVTFGPNGIRVSDAGQSDGRLGSPGTRVVSEADVAETGAGSSEEVLAGEDNQEESLKAPGVGRAVTIQRLTIYIPIPRVVIGSGPTASRAESPFTTVVISVSTGSLLRLYGQPEPEPTPEPSFRTREEEPDTVDAVSGGGGSDFVAAGEPQPLEAPLVIAPGPVMAPPAAPPVLPPVVPPVVPPVIVAPPPQLGPRLSAPTHVPGSPSIVAGGAPPGLRGPAPAPAPPPATGAVPVGTQGPRLDYQQYLRTAKVTDMAAVALPGVAGLLVMTFSGTVIGYRQAKAGHMLRQNQAVRFMA